MQGFIYKGKVIIQLNPEKALVVFPHGSYEVKDGSVDPDKYKDHPSFQVITEESCKQCIKVIGYKGRVE